MKVFLCFAFEKGELQRGHLSPDKESRKLFAKCKGEALIIGVTDKRRCRGVLLPTPPPHPGSPPAAPGKPRVAPALPSLLPHRPRLLPHLPSIWGLVGRGVPQRTGVMDVPNMGCHDWRGNVEGVPLLCPLLWAGRSAASKAHPMLRPRVLLLGETTPWWKPGGEKFGARASQEHLFCHGSPAHPSCPQGWELGFTQDSLCSELGACGGEEDPLGTPLPLPREPLRSPASCPAHCVAGPVMGHLRGVGAGGVSCWGLWVTADGRGQQPGWGTGTVGLSPELGHQSSTAEPPSQKLRRRRATALSIIQKG